MLDAILPVIRLLLGVLVDLFLGKINEPDTAVVADSNRALRSRLEQRVREYQDGLDS